MSRRARSRSLVAAISIAALALLGAHATSIAQNGTTTPPVAASQTPAPPTIEEVQQRLDELRAAAQEIPEESRAPLTANLDAAKAAIDATKAHESERAAFERDAREAPALNETIRAELAKPPGDPDLGLSETPSVSEVEQAIAQATAELAAAREEAQRLEGEKERRTQRVSKEIPERIAEIRSRRRAILDDLGSAAPPADAPLSDKARYLRLQSEQLAADRHLAKLEAEQQSYIAREELLPARRDRALRRVQVAQSRLDRLQARLAEARKRQASQAAEQAARLKQDAQRFAEGSPTLKAIADENVDLTSRLSGQGGIAEKLGRVDRQRTRARDDIENIRERFRDVRKKVDEIGLTDALGVILRRELDALQDAKGIRATSLAQSHAVSDAQLQVVQLDDRISELRKMDVATLLEQVKTELPGDQPEAFQSQVLQTAQEVIEQRARNLVALRDNFEKYVTRLAELQGAERELIDVTEAYRTYIEERILWVRSVIRGRLMIRPSEVIAAFQWMLFSPEWSRVPGIVVTDTTRNPAPYVGLVLVVLILFVIARRARAGLRNASKTVASFRTDRFAETMRALGCTVLIVLRWPTLVFAIAMALRLPDDQVPVALAAGAGLQRCATAILLISLLARLLKPGGVGDVHFRWRKAGSRVVRSNLRWLLPLVLPLLFLVSAMSHQDDTAHLESLGRLCFVVMMASLGVFAARVLAPRGRFVGPMLKPGSWPERLRFVWYPILPGIAVVLAFLPLWGYFYSAVRLSAAVRFSFWFILLIIVIHALLLRWLFIARRRLAVEQARKSREAAVAAREQAGESGSIDVPIEEEINIPAMDQQTRRLFRVGITVLVVVGLYGIWADELPALRMLKRVQIWPSVQVVDLPLSSIDPILLERDNPSAQPSSDPATTATTNGAAQSASSTSTPGSSPQPGVLPGLSSGAPEQPAEPEPVAERRITLADAGLAIIIAVITVLAGRNLPGLLEIAFLTRLPLDAGSRFAIATVARYAIFIVGITVAFSAIKIGWSQIQWLAAALTFGLAFGLQEIFANFVSGLIILAERPVRVGDTVTVGTVSGTVTRIQMRATTITDWDRKELIVPNKAFITDQVINWTLSSNILRVIVEVGVAYGSDVERVERLLYEAAAECEFIIDEPPSRVWFLGFGDNSLNFRLQGFIGTIDHMLAARSAIHFLVNRKFNDADISIAFPQRDVHFDTHGKPLEIKIVDAQGRQVDPPAPAEPPAS